MDETTQMNLERLRSGDREARCGAFLALLEATEERVDLGLRSTPAFGSAADRNLTPERRPK
jgi:hypothetical protein